MYIKIIFPLLFAALLITSCKEKNKDVDVVVDENVAEVPNISDQHFTAALATLINNKKEAAMHLKEGIASLLKEGSEGEGSTKTNFDKAIRNLNIMITHLEEGRNISESTLKEAIANAELNTYHNYLSTTDIFVVQDEQQVASNKIKTQFYKYFNNLKNNKDNIKTEAKKESSLLLSEGNKLEQEYAAWEQKVMTFNQKAKDHIKKHIPEEYYEDITWQ